VAEEAFSEGSQGSVPPIYVIGTEVPLPGGVKGMEDALSVTHPSNVAETIEATQEAFSRRGLTPAWQRVIAVVVQPGVEYGDASLFEYDRAQAVELARFIESYGGLIYEAHSTDYQPAESLRQLVEDHFAILKVGPALTFALREGIFALACIEEELLARRPDAELSRVRERLDEAMLANPIYWQKYYQGDDQALYLSRKYSFSDRSRYYWPVPEVQSALSRLLQNVEEQPLPLTLLSQYLPVQYARIRGGEITNDPRAILLDKVRNVLADYSYACGYLTSPV
jgi:D-tagatose-1,6-bisphosphate aldolase subunit GatZ/KbaZ